MTSTTKRKWTNRPPIWKNASFFLSSPRASQPGRGPGFCGPSDRCGPGSPVSPPMLLSVLPVRLRAGRCPRLAKRTGPEAARGNLSGAWRAYGLDKQHAWVELPQRDCVRWHSPTVLPAAPYFAEIHPRPWYKYEPSAAALICRNIHEEEHQRGAKAFPYAWHTRLQLPCANANRPTFITMADAGAIIMARRRHARSK